MTNPDILRIPYTEILRVLVERFCREGLPKDRAELCARLFADASRDGVPSHGLNRFGLMVKWVRAGTVLPHGELKRLGGIGGLERWDGGLGLGPWNAWHSMRRAIELARQHGIGCVGLRNTNHWMRAGNYGWQAAEAGCIGLCWTNTIALMPAYGGKGRRVGNNPLVLAVPRRYRPPSPDSASPLSPSADATAPSPGAAPPTPDAGHLVLDMAMSQYSMGKLGLFRNAGTLAPLTAGYDGQGHETRDPIAIMNGGSLMPIGYWKGSGLATLLDAMAAVIAGGAVTRDIRAEKNEQGVSQTFIALDIQALAAASGADPGELPATVEGIIRHIKSSGEAVLYPGERSFAARQESLQRGVAVDRQVWEGILNLAPPSPAAPAPSAQ